MVEKANSSVKIDLNHFKLHLHLKPKLELTLHFDSPSRRFYLSLIGLVVNEMKKRGRITSISLEEHLDVLALLNKTVGAGAGSSERKHLLPRIYRKWKDALPDLENAPLFRVVGRKKRYDELMEKVYGFSEAEKDSWANLFEYKGSHQDVRLRFSIDRLGACLDDVIIFYGQDPGLTDGDAWEGFIANLGGRVEDKPKNEGGYSKQKTSESRLIRFRSVFAAMPIRWRWTIFGPLTGLIVGIALIAVWKSNLFPPKAGLPSMEKIALSSFDKSSIAVLPFRNNSDDPEQDHFSDGLTDQVITGLSKFPGLSVIASSSVLAYKGKDIKVEQVHREHGVNYVLEGSGRKDGNRIRITVQLIDAVTGYNLWSEIYDRELRDIFTVQDEITLKILNSLMVQIKPGEIEIYQEKYTNNLQAYFKFLDGIGYYLNRRLDESIKSFQESHTLDPQYAMAYAWEAWAHLQKIFYPSPTFEQLLDKALDCSEKCLALDDKLYACYMQLGLIFLGKRDYEKAVYLGQRAVNLNPNSAAAATHLGYILSRTGRYEEALREFERASRLSPFDRSFTWYHIGCTYLFMGRNFEAIVTLKKAKELSPRSLPYHIFLAVAYSSEGRMEEARLEASQIMKIYPNFTMKHFVTILSFKDKAVSDLVVNGLLKAGLK